MSAQSKIVNNSVTYIFHIICIENPHRVNGCSILEIDVVTIAEPLQTHFQQEYVYSPSSHNLQLGPLA